MSTGFNTDGFITLVKKQSTEQTKLSKRKNKDMTKPKFKKGSWKHWLYKRLKKLQPSKVVSKFHDTKLKNIVVYRNDKPRASISSEKMTKELLTKLETKFPDAYILINSGDNMFTKINLSAYKKLMDIEKIVMHFELTVIDDGEDEPQQLYEKDVTIDSINRLCNVVNTERVCIDSVYDIQARCTWYSVYEFDYRIMVQKRDGSIEYYKDSINKFLKAYDLDLI